MTERKTLVIVLHTLDLEGTQVMALRMLPGLKRAAIDVQVLVLQERGDAALDLFHEHGIEPIRLHLEKKGIDFYRRLFLATRRVFLSLRPNAILSFPFGWHAVLGAAARTTGKATLVVHAGNYPPHWMGVSFLKFKALVWAGRPNTARVVACSDHVAEGLRIHFGLRDEEVSVVPNGVSFDQFDFHAFPRDPPFKFGVVSRLDETRDLRSILFALARLVESGRDVELHLAGDGPDRANLRRWAERAGLADRVIFHGRVLDIPAFLQQLHGFVFPAKHFEGLGNALIEALAARRPTVASAVPACVEVTEKGRWASLYEPGNVPALASAMANLQDRHAEHADTAARARKALKKHYGVDRMLSGYLRALRL